MNFYPYMIKIVIPTLKIFQFVILSILFRLKSLETFLGWNRLGENPFLIMIFQNVTKDDNC